MCGVYMFGNDTAITNTRKAQSSTLSFLFLIFTTLVKRTDLFVWNGIVM